MVAERLEIRIDRERRRQLLEYAAAQGVTVSEAVRAMIDRALEEADRAERRRAAEALCRLEIEDVPDPEELSRQLDETYAIPDPY